LKKFLFCNNLSKEYYEKIKPCIYLVNVFSFWLLGFVTSWYLCFEMNLGAPGLWIGIIVGLTAAAVLNIFRFFYKSKLQAQYSEIS